MYGLAGALVLGFLDLTAGQAQNRFFNELEEWLAGLTRLSSGALAEGEGSVPVYVQALLEQTAENMESLQQVLARDEENRIQMNQAVLTLNERLGVAGRHDAGQPAPDAADRRDADRARPGFAAPRRTAAAGTRSAEAICATSKAYLQRLLSESEQGRARSTAELRNDLRLLTRTVAALAEPPR